MQTVSSELIVEAWERQCALAEEPARALIQQFMEEQPAVGIYLMVCDEQLGEEAEQSQLVALAACAWEAMTRVQGRRLNMVRPDAVERADDANTRMLENLDEASEFEWRDSALGLLNNYNQQPLLVFFLEILMADDEETPELAPDLLGMELFWLKTVVDCFDQ